MAKRTTSSKTAKTETLYDLSAALGPRDEFTAILVDPSRENVTVWAAGGWYWVVRGRWTTNERHQCPADIERSLGLYEPDPTKPSAQVWRRVEGLPF